MSAKPKKAHGYDRVALALQGGGSLGAYHIGVCQAMHEAGYDPDVVAGISIGGITAALIAGNAPEQRVAALKNFWKDISYPDFGEFLNMTADTRRLHNMFSSMQGFIYGQPNFFEPLMGQAKLSVTDTPASQALSLYDVKPLIETLKKHVDFDRINRGETRLLLGAVKIKTGGLVFFDSAKQKITPEHVLASGALPPAFPPVMIDGELYWDGGCVSNTPLEALFNMRPEARTLTFVIDLFSAEGEEPKNMQDVTMRAKDITYASRSHHHIDHIADKHNLRKSIHHLLSKLPANTAQDIKKDIQELASSSDFDIVHCIYKSLPFEIATKDCEFSRLSIVDRAEHGYNDINAALQQSPWLNQPQHPHIGCRVHRFVTSHQAAAAAPEKAKA
jgi:NTE family protein